MNPTGLYFHKNAEGDDMVVHGSSGTFVRGFFSRKKVIDLGDGRVSNGALVTWYDQDTDTAWIERKPVIDWKEGEGPDDEIVFEDNL